MLTFLVILLTALNTINCDGNGRIAGGHDVTDRTQVPYQATLRWNNNFNTCGGAILNRRYVLTSAYCVSHTYTNEMKVVAGDISIDNKLHTFETEIEEIKLHEKYNKNVILNGYDLALVRVKSPFEFSDFIKPLSLWTSIKRPQYACTVAGYGKMENTMYPSNLKIAKVHVQDNDFCNETYKTLKETIPESEFCAGEHKTDSCDGDQGSPLVCENQIVGIRSNDFECIGVHIDYPGLYLNVSFFNSWITRNMHDINSSTTSTATLLMLCITFINLYL